MKGKKFKPGKHFGHGTEVTGGLAGDGTGLGRKGKPYGLGNIKTSGDITPSALQFTGSAPPSHKRKKK
jgi:hypothetical protein